MKGRIILTQKNYVCIVLCVMLICLYGCIGGGTHGYIKRYHYAVSKYNLERAVHHVININPDIQQDSVKGYYNNDTSYITISIAEDRKAYNYILHFYGGKEYWDTSITSAISISYAYDENGNGGSEGNGGVEKQETKLRKKLIEPFEKELVTRVDSFLNMEHTEE